jgi:hypothetical protein
MPPLPGKFNRRFLDVRGAGNWKHEYEWTGRLHVAVKLLKFEVISS